MASFCINYQLTALLCATAPWFPSKKGTKEKEKRRKGGLGDILAPRGRGPTTALVTREFDDERQRTVKELPNPALKTRSVLFECKKDQFICPGISMKGKKEWERREGKNI